MDNKLLIKYIDTDILQQDEVVLANVNLEVYSGEFVYLLGKVGSGKSTLLKSFYGEVKTDKGEAGVLGYDLHLIKTREIPFLRRKIGIVFQDFQLLTDRTVYQNLEFVLKATGWTNKSAIDEQITGVLEQVGMLLKSKIIGIYILLVFSTGYTFAQHSKHASAEEKDVIGNDSTDISEEIDNTLDEMLNSWVMERSTPSPCESSDVPESVPDDVYKERLSKLPCLMEMPFNSVIRSYIELYTVRKRRQVEFMVPFDSRSAFQTSGIRLGTPAITTRGAKEDLMELIAELIETVLSNVENEAVITSVREKVNKTMEAYPLFAY